MKKDALGAIFRVEKKLGRGDVFELVSHFRNGRTTSQTFHHEFNDGLGALVQESEKWSGPVLQLPAFQLKTPATATQILTGLRGLKEDMTPSQTRWKNLQSTAPYTPAHLAWRVLSRQTTDCILAAAKGMGVSLNALLIHTINQVIAEKLLMDEQDDCRWLVPVNLRRSSIEQQLRSNCTSSIGLRFSRNSSPQQIDCNYRGSLNKWRAIATHALAHASTLLGEDRLLKLARLRGEKNSWIGSFSNLGVWNFGDQEENDSWPMAISIAPPAGTPCFPVGVGIITWQGRMSISLRLHAALINDNFRLPEELLTDALTRLELKLEGSLEIERSS
ncbi:MAG: hypothetical protein ACO3A4_13735 [Silvanigrellaceae bacterium]